MCFCGFIGLFGFGFEKFLGVELEFACGPGRRFLRCAASRFRGRMRWQDEYLPAFGADFDEGKDSAGRDRHAVLLMQGFGDSRVAPALTAPLPNLFKERLQLRLKGFSRHSRS